MATTHLDRGGSALPAASSCNKLFSVAEDSPLALGAPEEDKVATSSESDVQSPATPAEKKAGPFRPGKSNREASRLGDVGLVGNEPFFGHCTRNSETVMLHCSSIGTYISRACGYRQNKNTHPTYADDAFRDQRFLKLPRRRQAAALSGPDASAAAAGGRIKPDSSRLRCQEAARCSERLRPRNAPGRAPQLVSSSTLRRMNWRNRVMRLECRSSSG